MAVPWDPAQLWAGGLVNQQCTSFPEMGGYKLSRQTKSPVKTTSGHAMQRRSTSVLAVQRCPPTVHTVQRCHTPGLAEQRCPTPVHPKQKDVYEELLEDEDVTKEILEDVTKEVLEEKKMGATLILTQPSLRSGCVNLLLGLIPTQTSCTSGSPMVQIHK